MERRGSPNNYRIDEASEERCQCDVAAGTLMTEGVSDRLAITTKTCLSPLWYLVIGIQHIISVPSHIEDTCQFI